MNEEVLTILKRNRLSITDSRQKKLEFFLQSNGALPGMVVTGICGERK